MESVSISLNTILEDINDAPQMIDAARRAKYASVFAFFFIMYQNLLLEKSIFLKCPLVQMFLLSFVFNVLIVYVRFLKPKHMKKRIIKKKNFPATSYPTQHYPNKDRKKREEIEDLQNEFNIK